MPRPAADDQQQQQHQRRSASTPGQIASGAERQDRDRKPDQRHALVVHHVHHQPAGDGGKQQPSRPSAGSAPCRIGWRTDAAPPRNRAARKSSCRPACPCCRRRRASRSAPPDCRARASGKNGSAVDTSRQANRPHSTAEASSSAPICGEIQSKRRPPHDSASSSATAADHHQQRADAHRACACADETARAEHARGHAERDKAERQVDPEDQRPVDMLGQKSAEHRPAHRGGANTAPI